MPSLTSKLQKYFQQVYETHPNEFSEQHGAAESIYNQLVEFAYEHISQEAGPDGKFNQATVDEVEQFIENDGSSMRDATADAWEQLIRECEHQ